MSHGLPNSRRDPCGTQKTHRIAEQARIAALLRARRTYGIEVNP